MAERKPNIIYILDDDHRADLMGYTGHLRSEEMGNPNVIKNG